MKKSLKDQTTRAFQTGGYNPPAVPQPTQPYSQPTQVDPRTGTYTLPGTGIAGYQVPSGTPTGYTPWWCATLLSACAVYWRTVSNGFADN